MTDVDIHAAQARVEESWALWAECGDLGALRRAARQAVALVTAATAAVELVRVPERERLSVVACTRAFRAMVERSLANERARGWQDVAERLADGAEPDSVRADVERLLKIEGDRP